MENQPISLRKERSVGEILSDSFNFAKITKDRLFPLLVKNVGVVIVIAVLANAYVAATLPLGSAFGDPTDVSFLGSAYFITAFFGLIATLLLVTTVLQFMKAYAEAPHAVDQTNVVDKSKALLLFAYMILSTIIISFGFLFFFFPGIYLLVPLSIGYMVLIIEDTSITGAISRSFKLVKGRWWVTFGTLLVVVIVIGLISLVVQIPNYIYMFSKGLAVANDTDVSGGGFDPVAAIISLISTAASYLLYVIMIIAGGLIYFDLDEIKGNTGLLGKIEKLGELND